MFALISSETRRLHLRRLERSLSNATIANFVGQQAVNFAINLGYVDRENVLVIDGVPCAQMVLM